MEVKTHPEHTAHDKHVPRSKFVWLSSYILAATICLVLYFFLRFHILNIAGKYHSLLQKLSLAAFFVTLVLFASRLTQVLIIRRSHSKYKRYNLLRLTNLLSLIAAAIIVVSFLFANWYAAAVSLGLISLILGFALQTPISSFIGWIYIIVRNPYRIGDRIQIDNFRGDVIEIGYMDTTLWEFAGDYLTNDLPSGRLIRFPNSLVLQSSVFNYSWRDFRFIWNEIPFHVAYESDLPFVEKTIRNVTKDELGPEMAERIEELKELVKESPIDEVDIKEYPFVSLRINANTWVEASVTYLVPPRKAAYLRTRIIRRVLDTLNREPDRVMFPKSNAR